MRILAIVAHPDDAELLCAGTLALCAQRGDEVFIAIATNGNVGTGDPTVTSEQIATIRHQEAKDSCAIIGAKLIWMNFDDEWLFNNEESRTRFIDAIREARPDVLIIHDPNDYHPDHRTAGEIARDRRRLHASGVRHVNGEEVAHGACEETGVPGRRHAEGELGGGSPHTEQSVVDRRDALGSVVEPHG